MFSNNGASGPESNNIMSSLPGGEVVVYSCRLVQNLHILSGQIDVLVLLLMTSQNNDRQMTVTAIVASVVYSVSPKKLIHLTFDHDFGNVDRF